MAIVVRFGREGKVKSAYCTEDELVGDFVYIEESQGDSTIFPEQYDQVRKADPMLPARLPAVGVIIYKEPFQYRPENFLAGETFFLCKVQYDGETPPIYEDLEIGRIYFLHLLGAISRNAPFPTVPGTKSVVQPVAVATTQNKILVKPTNSLIWRIAE